MLETGKKLKREVYATIRGVTQGRGRGVHTFLKEEEKRGETRSGGERSSTS